MLMWHGSVIDGMTVRARIVLALRARNPRRLGQSA